MMPTTYPILEAIRANDAQQISALIQEGVRLDVKDASGFGVWHLLADCPDASLMPLFDPVFPYTEPQEDALYGGSTPFLRAIGSGRLPIVKALLERGADPAQHDRDHYNAWHYIALADRPDFIPLLDTLFPYVDPPTIGADTPLYLAFEREHLAVSLALVIRGGSLDRCNECGVPALEMAPYLCRERHSEKARFFCEVIRHHHRPLPLEPVLASGCPEAVYAWLQRTYPDNQAVQVLAATDALACVPVAEWPVVLPTLIGLPLATAVDPVIEDVTLG